MDYLVTIEATLNESVSLWLPDDMTLKGTDIYAHGVELPSEYDSEIPIRYDIIEPEACKLLVFRENHIRIQILSQLHYYVWNR